MRLRYACREVKRTPEPALHIPRWPLDQSEYSVKWFAFLNKRGGEVAIVETRSEPYDET